MQENTINFVSRCIVDVLRRSGVYDVVACPGSRNTPLLIALSKCESIHTTMVVDERVAAFVALGMASTSGKPVAVVCTSGTALLNFSPAVAEAFYRKVPLIVISADRPLEWIDQDDSQTIRQFRSLGNFVKQSYDIPAYETEDLKWFTNRVVNDAVLTACMLPMGPVHINVQIPEPIGELCVASMREERIVKLIQPRADLPVVYARELGRELASPRRVMVICGFNAPDSILNRALNKLSRLPNFVILTESIANMHGDDFVSDIDATLSSMSRERQEMLRPDVIISLGGSLVSRFVKQYIRGLGNVEHWHVGKSFTTVDCFKSLKRRIEMQPSVFMQQLASAMQPHTAESSYRREWIRSRDAARSLHQSFVAKVPWTDLKAFSVIMPAIPRNFNLHLSNGTPIRYAQLFSDRQFHRVECNRGVSGIDGATSTAVGASLKYKAAPTLLITGDMSAQYDLGAFASGLLSPRFKVIVMCNGGGGIFHFIKSTCNLDIVEECFDDPCVFPSQGVASAFGLKYFEASDEASLREELKPFLAEDASPAMLAVYTDSELSGGVLKDYFLQKTKI